MDVPSLPFANVADLEELSDRELDAIDVATIAGIDKASAELSDVELNDLAEALDLLVDYKRAAAAELERKGEAKLSAMQAETAEAVEELVERLRPLFDLMGDEDYS